MSNQNTEELNVTDCPERRDGCTYKSLTKRISSASIQIAANDKSFVMNASKINALRQSINRHNDNVAKILLASKESLDRKTQIESAFRACKEAFIELSTAYLTLLENDSASAITAEELKSVISNSVSKVGDSLLAHISDLSTPREHVSADDSCKPSYASVASAGTSKVRVARGPTLDIPKTTNLLILPKDNVKFSNSRDTKEVFQRALKPSDYNLKVKSISSVRNKGIRVEAHSVDLPRIKDSRELEEAGLKLLQENKIHPRLIIHGVPRGMTRDDLKSEIIALNLKDVDTTEVKIVYVFPPRENRKFTNCILEVPSNIRTVLLKEKHVFVNFSACRISDYINVLQCFKCLAFGHLARHCKFSALCGHCAGDHEMMECQLRNESSICGNCKRWAPQEERTHSALDSKKCPILHRRIADRVKSINYG